MDIRVQLDDLLPLDVGEHHERVHRPLDVVWGVLFRLQIRLCECDCQIIVNLKIRKNSLGKHTLLLNRQIKCLYKGSQGYIFSSGVIFFSHPPLDRIIFKFFDRKYILEIGY